MNWASDIIEHRSCCRLPRQSEKATAGEEIQTETPKAFQFVES
jgi:hypothetical protein